MNVNIKDFTRSLFLSLLFTRSSALHFLSFTWRAAPTATSTSFRFTMATAPQHTNSANTVARAVQRSCAARTIHCTSGFAPTMWSVAAVSRWPGSRRFPVGDSCRDQGGFLVEVFLVYVFFLILVCGGELTEAYGNINSPGYPGNYPPNRDCYWRVGVEPGLLITFAFGTLSMEHHPDCEHDYLEVNITASSKKL